MLKSIGQIARGSLFITLLWWRPLPAQSTATSPDSGATMRAAIASVTKFLETWRVAWARGESDRRGPTTRRPTPGSVGDRRLWAYYCFRLTPGWQFGELPGIIKSTRTLFAVCPSWYIGNDTTGVEDERLSIDNALTPPRRALVVSARSQLIRELSAAATQLPQNAWLSGQRVRFLVDQREFEAAETVARECSASAWWCRSLHAYAAAARGDLFVADSLFIAAETGLAPVERCRLRDISALLDSAARPAYDKLNCTQRDSAVAWFWAMADPLLSVKGNERRAEQRVRAMVMLLRSGLPRDERYSWRVETGADALIAMVERYGWPSYANWGGSDVDDEHSRAHSRLGPNPPYTTYEYIPGRVHLVPNASVVFNPFDALVSDWDLTDRSEQPRPALAPWWPREHAAIPYRLTQLHHYQVAMLRRDSGAVLVAAAALPPGNAGASQWNGARAALSVLHGPDNALVVACSVTTTRVAVARAIPSRPALIGIEVASNAVSRSFAWLRMGVRPPDALLALERDAVSVSDPVLLRVTSNEAELPAHPDSLLANMLETTEVSRGRLGVYWETYGLTPTDTIEIAVWLERYSRQSLARRLGMRLNIAQDLNTPVVMSWTEPQGGSRATNIGMRTPIVPRSVIVDISKLPAGEYLLSIAAKSPQGAAAVGRRKIVVR